MAILESRFREEAKDFLKLLAAVTLSTMTQKWAHFVAIGGTGMGALAALMQDLGYFVTGSDGPLYPPMSSFLESRKIPLVSSYDAKHLSAAFWQRSELAHHKHPNLIVVGNAISRGHPEATEAERLVAEGSSERMSFAQALSHFCIRGTESFVVAGTHGKTTTTSLLTWCLESLGQNPGFFIGGIPKNFGLGCRVGAKKVFVSEGDEYDTAYWDKESKFLHYLPTWVLCTGIEFDHADIFKDVRSIEAAFEKLVSKTTKGWVLVDDESSPRRDSLKTFPKLCNDKGIKLLRYGFSSQSSYQIVSVDASPHPVRNTEIGSKIVFKTPQWGEKVFFSPTIGKHNALNICGILAVLLESGHLNDPELFQAALLSFKGIKRRQEEVFRSENLVVIDDFAHHPTAIRETLAALKMRYPDYHMAAFFEPRSATSGRNVLADDFAKAFDDAEAIFFTPCTKTNIPQSERLDVEQVIAEAIGRGKKNQVGFVKSTSTDLAGEFLTWSLRVGHTPNDKFLAVVMSNGPFDGLHQKLVSAWQKS